MARPITLFTIQYGDMPLEELCKQAQKMGFEGLELSAAHLDKHDNVEIGAAAAAWLTQQGMVEGDKVDVIEGHLLRGEAADP